MEFCHTGTSHSEINCLLCCVLHRPRRCEPGRRMASGLERLVTLVFQVEGLLAWRSLPFACPWMDFKVSVTFYMDSDRNLCKICVIINVCILRRWLTFSDSSLRIFQILLSSFCEGKRLWTLGLVRVRCVVLGPVAILMGSAQVG